jgi:uncharacterized heparinase superfamily protein
VSASGTGTSTGTGTGTATGTGEDYAAPWLDMPSLALRRVSGLMHLPREHAMGRLAYTLKQPFFASPVYRLVLSGRPPTALAAALNDPWPGNAEAGTQLLDDVYTLAGHTVKGPRRLWSPSGASPDWLKALHGFEWLADLRSVGGDLARRRARHLVGDWLEHYPRWDPVAWAPEVTGRRLVSWLGQYDFFAASAAIDFRHQVLDSLARQARHLDHALPAGLAGTEAITACKGLIYAGVSLPDSTPLADKGLAMLQRALNRQILADGGHVERCPRTQLTVLRDLIDVRAALHAGGLETPADLQTTIERMAPLLRLFRHGDGGLALFNGADEAEAWQVETVLQRAGGRPRPLSLAPQSGFQRLQAGRTVVLVDAGCPPSPSLAREAHAGTLSFEMSLGRHRLIVNCGCHPAGHRWSRAYRASAAHSTLVINDTNSSKISPDGALSRRPETVACRREEAEGSHWLDMSHDGYLPPFGLVHQRRLYLAAGGEDLRGEDCLVGPDGHDFTIRFHLHPDARAALAQDKETVLLRAGRGGGWRFRARGAQLALEPSIYLGRRGEVRRTQQIVLSGRTCVDETTVKWALVREESPAKPAAARA